MFVARNSSLFDIQVLDVRTVCRSIRMISIVSTECIYHAHAPHVPFTIVMDVQFTHIFVLYKNFEILIL